MTSSLQVLRDTLAAWPVQDGENRTPLPWLSLYMTSRRFLELPHNKPFYLLVIAEGHLSVAGIAGVRDYREGQLYLSKITSPVGVPIKTSGTGRFAAVCIELLMGDLVPFVIELDEGLVAGMLSGGRQALETLPDMEGIFACILRLLSFTDDSLKSRFMAGHIKRELVFSLLTGGYGPTLLNSIIICANADRIIRANTWIRNNFRSIFSVDELAASINMSVSLFHQRFRDIVGMAPLQCQKFLRLNEARRLILDGKLNVTEASLEVGYGNVSQFIGDYRKMFGASPKGEMMELRHVLKK